MKKLPIKQDQIYEITAGEEAGFPPLTADILSAQLSLLPQKKTFTVCLPSKSQTKPWRPCYNITTIHPWTSKLLSPFILSQDWFCVWHDWFLSCSFTSLSPFYGFLHFLNSTQIGSKALCSVIIYACFCCLWRCVCFFCVVSYFRGFTVVVFHFYVLPISNIPPLFSESFIRLSISNRLHDAHGLHWMPSLFRFSCFFYCFYFFSSFMFFPHVFVFLLVPVIVP